MARNRLRPGARLRRFEFAVQNATLIPTLDESSRNAHFVRDRLPAEGLFAGLEWRISPSAFRLSREVADEIESLGRVLRGTGDAGGIVDGGQRAGRHAAPQAGVRGERARDR